MLIKNSVISDALFPSSKQKQESKTQTSSEDDTSPPAVLPLVLNFSPEKTATEGAENALKEAEVHNEVAKAQNELAEEKQPEVRNDTVFSYKTTK